MADLLINIGYAVAAVFIALCTIYLVLRVGTLAILKSIDEHERRKTVNEGG